jgi:aspartyl-tRNA(Asn)/glutamyl-tRNA(Gln) amidotransferase subunit B
VIGLEIHVQLSTKTKMFCGCSPSFGDEPNLHTCPVCLAHPGTLPTINEQAIRYALMIAAALECEVKPRSIFHRKNYFYPDLPKGYQISQYDEPLGVNGRLGEVRIHRAHLEEDAAKLIHTGGETGRIHGSGVSLVDFNRGGTPLVEIVSEPDLRSAAQAREWAQLLRTTIRQLGVSDVNMEEGSLRVDANVSVRRAGSEELGVKTELKNMNSFRFLERGIEAELVRQRGLLDSGEEVVQETLHFHPEDGTLTPLRSKEYAHDYRYFPEPDLVPVVPTEQMLEEAREALPELPAARRERYVSEVGLSEEAASALAFQSEYGEYFERAIAAADGASAKAIANWVTGELVASLRQAGADEDPLASKATPESVAALAGLVEGKTISHGAGKQVLARLVAEGGDPSEIVESEGLAQISDSSELEAIVDRAIEAEAEAAEQVRSGNQKAIGRIVGAAMRESKGRADGGAVTKLIRERLEAS